MRLSTALTCYYNPPRVTAAARSMPRPMARRLAVGRSPTTGPPLLRCLAADAKAGRDLGPGVPGFAQPDHGRGDGLIQPGGEPGHVDQGVDIAARNSPDLASAGVQVHNLRKIAGHGSLSTTQRYLHPDNRSITDAGDALSAHISVRRSPNGPQLRVV